MGEQDTVTGGQDPNVPNPGTIEDGSVPEGTTPQITSDAVTDTAKFQEQLERLENDRRRQQSVYDRQIAELNKRNQELLQAVEETRTKEMTEAERSAYEATKWKTEFENLRAQIEAERQINEYADVFAQAFGISKDKLDLTNQETVAQSGWQAVLEERQRLVAELEQLKGTAQTAPGAKQPPQNNQKIITGSGGVPTTKPSPVEMRQSVAKALGRTSITDDEFFTYMEKRPELMNQWLQD